MAPKFSTETEEKLAEIETFLSKNKNLSGESTPNQEDASVLDSLKDTPDKSKFPHLHAWYENLSKSTAEERKQWGKKDEDDDDVDDVDLFGGVTEEEKQALEEEQKKKEEEKKNKKKAVIAKSRVTFDVKAYEIEQDFDALAGKILETIKKDGLVWQDSYEVVPVGFGIKCLRLTMIIEDDKISADDILEEIQNTWEDDVQSCDIVEFNKI